MFSTFAQKFSLGCLVIGLSVVAGTARAELDPELAAVGNKNNQALFIGGNLGFGQSYATGGSSPDVAYKLTAEPGFIFRRDSWGRIEASLELGFGQAGYTRKGGAEESVDVALGLIALAKFGYGTSVGSNSFLVYRFGLGPMAMKLDGKTAAGTKVTTDGSTWGVATMVGIDYVTAMNAALDFVGGLSLTHAQFNVGSLKVNGIKVQGNESVNLNIPALQLGLRLTI